MATFTDDFNRSNRDLSVDAEWENCIGNGCAIDNNQVNGASYVSVSIVATSHMAFAADQEATVTIANKSAYDYCGCVVRGDTNGNCYGVRTYSGTGTHLRVVRYDNASLTQIAVVAFDTSNGDKVKLAITGTTLELFVDSGSGFVSQGTWTDSTHSTGQPGVYYIDGNSNASYIDDFIGTDNAGGGVTVDASLTESISLSSSSAANSIASSQLSLNISLLKQVDVALQSSASAQLNSSFLCVINNTKTTSSSLTESILMNESFVCSTVTAGFISYALDIILNNAPQISAAGSLQENIDTGDSQDNNVNSQAGINEDLQLNDSEANQGAYSAIISFDATKSFNLLSNAIKSFETLFSSDNSVSVDSNTAVLGNISFSELLEQSSGNTIVSNNDLVLNIVNGEVYSRISNSLASLTETSDYNFSLSTSGDNDVFLVADLNLGESLNTQSDQGASFSNELVLNDILTTGGQIAALVNFSKQLSDQSISTVSIDANLDLALQLSMVDDVLANFDASITQGFLLSELINSISVQSAELDINLNQQITFNKTLVLNSGVTVDLHITETANGVEAITNVVTPDKRCIEVSTNQRCITITGNRVIDVSSNKRTIN